MSSESTEVKVAQVIRKLAGQPEELLWYHEESVKVTKGL